MTSILHPSHFSLENAIRPTILSLPVYITSTFDDFQPRTSILLDANENSLGSCLESTPTNGRTNGSRNSHGEPHTNGTNGRPNASQKISNHDDVDLAHSEIAALHRYPSSSQAQLKTLIAEWRGLPGTKNICLGVGAADIIDLVIRVTCTPFKDAIMITPPTFGLYQVRAALNEVEVVRCPLEIANGEFTLKVDEVLSQLRSNPQVKMVILASPGNPTGTLISLSDIKRVLDFPGFKGIVVVDEAYIDFCPSPEEVSALTLLPNYANLLVIQSFSKTFGLAGIRLGMAFAHHRIIEMFNKVQMPYCVSTPTSTLARLALSPICKQRRLKLTAQMVVNREQLIQDLTKVEVTRLGVGEPLGANHANFILVPILERDTMVANRRDNARARAVSERLKKLYAISIRFVGELLGCQACLRITVGTEEENRRVVQGLISVLNQC